MASWFQAADAIRASLVAALPGSKFPPTKIYIGWPEPNQLLEDLRKGFGAHISIYPLDGRLTSRYNLDPIVKLRPSTETVDIEGFTATLGGTLTVGDNIFLYLDGRFGFAANVSPDDDINAVAIKLAAAVNSSTQGYSAVAVGPAITVSGAWKLAGRAFGGGTSFVEVARFTRRFQISIWAKDPIDRGGISNELVNHLAASQFIQFADMSTGRILFDNSTLQDFTMAAGYCKHDYFFSVEYAHYLTEEVFSVGDIKLSCSLPKPDDTTEVISSVEIF